MKGKNPQQTEEVFIGVDNGLAGALVALQGKTILEAVTMPVMAGGNGKNEYDVHEILSFFLRYPDATVILEKAHYTPAMGGVAAFSFAKNYGIILGLLTALKMRYHIVHAKTWQGIVFRDQPHGDTKASSAIIARRLFPDNTFRASTRSTKIHDGLTDAACLAYYGKTFLYEKNLIEM